jgi:uncharacterized membrane protein
MHICCCCFLRITPIAILTIFGFILLVPIFDALVDSVFITGVLSVGRLLI